MASTSAGDDQHSSPSTTPEESPLTRAVNYGEGELATRKLAKRLQRYRRLASRNHWARSKRGMSLRDHLNVRKWSSESNGDIVRAARNHEPFMYRLDHRKNLPVHDGCVNTICWNATGEYILSGSDDCNLVITKPGDMFNTSQEDYSVLIKVPTHHMGNIFCARFIPNSADGRIVSCSSEGPIIVHDIYSSDPSEGIFNFNCHSETIYDVAPLADNDKVFLSCGEDKTIRLFDMRVHRSCARAGTCPHPALIRNSHAITTLHIHPMNSNLLLVGRADGLGLVYDRRKLPDITKFTRERAHAERLAGAQAPSYQFKHPLEGVVGQFSVPEMEERYRFTSLCYNDTGSEVLASYSGDYIYLFDHDRSSNFKLVQTLPAKSVAASEDSISDQTSDNDNQSVNAAERRHNSSDSSNGSGGGGGGGEASQPGRGTARGSRSARISRIRVRGDWSDTGVNSVPLSSSRRSREDGDGRREGARGRARPTSFLEQFAVTLGTRRTLGRSNQAAEIIAGPIRWDVPMGEANNRQERPIAEEEEEEEEEGEGDDEEEEEQQQEEEDDDEDDNSTLIDDDEDEHRDVSSDDDDNEGDENFEQYAERTVRNLVDEANEQAQRIIGNESTMMDLDRASNDSATSDNNRAPTAGFGAREKFKRTLQNLKSKFNNIPSYKPRVKYQGHRNSRTSVKESIFWGDNFIMSGSDCGRIMVWEKEAAKLVMAFQADERVVNCLAPNPCTYVLASSGIDYDIKLWSTQALRENPLVVGEAEMQRIIENNEEMLEESRYTLSVPPHLFFRVLASLVHPSR